MKTQIHNPINRDYNQGKDTQNLLKNFIRVGHDYFEIVKKQDRYGISRAELKVRKKSELLFDFGKEAVKTIRKFLDFTLEPDNLNYNEEIKGCYNLYSPFNHKPKKGEWKWTKILLEHVFEEQYPIGLKYIQALYQEPKKILPILALVSEERQTGKSTFIDWLSILFGKNMVIVDSKHLSSSHNSIIAHANIIAIEETLIEQSNLIESIKALSTQKTITVNPKYIQPYTSSFFGKIIMASNNERNFIKIDSKEIRFFIRKLNTPKFTNHNILTDLKNEIPAFIFYLNTLPKLVWDKSRQLFTTEELKNNNLSDVKSESKSQLYHELYDSFVEELNNEQPSLQVLMYTLIEIKDKWFKNNYKVTRSNIRKCLINEFGFENLNKSTRYGLNNNKIGKPYLIPRKYFGNDVIKVNHILQQTTY